MKASNEPRARPHERRAAAHEPGHRADHVLGRDGHRPRPRTGEPATDHDRDLDSRRPIQERPGSRDRTVAHRQPAGEQPEAGDQTHGRRRCVPAGHPDAEHRGSSSVTVATMVIDAPTEHVQGHMSIPERVEAGAADRAAPQQRADRSSGQHAADGNAVQRDRQRMAPVHGRPPRDPHHREHEQEARKEARAADGHDGRTGGRKSVGDQSRARVHQRELEPSHPGPRPAGGGERGGEHRHVPADRHRHGAGQRKMERQPEAQPAEAGRRSAIPARRARGAPPRYRSWRLCAR